jgi:hypothetical protein
MNLLPWQTHELQGKCIFFPTSKNFVYTFNYPTWLIHISDWSYLYFPWLTYSWSLPLTQEGNCFEESKILCTCQNHHATYMHFHILKCMCLWWIFLNYGHKLLNIFSVCILVLFNTLISLKELLPQYSLEAL